MLLLEPLQVPSSGGSDSLLHLCKIFRTLCELSSTEGDEIFGGGDRILRGNEVGCLENVEGEDGGFCSSLSGQNGIPTADLFWYV